MTSPQDTSAYDLDDAAADIAVIGMSGRFPRARNVAQFWENIANGVEAMATLTDAELAAAGVPESIRRSPDYVPVSSRLEDVECFDAEFFGYSPREAALIDPQARLCLELAWHALEDAGYNSFGYAGAIGVYAATSLSTYLLQNLAGRLDAQDFVLGLGNIPLVLGNGADFPATRVSYKLDLRGPSQAVQTACSSSLMAIHLARQSLLNGECDMALAGGASIYLPQDRGYRWREGMILSSDGHCRAFDAQADGIIFGRGGGMVLLKSLARALEDGDRIRAVIKGSAVNNDGSRKAGYNAPSVSGQSRVVTEALADAGVRADSISYVEAHGTGTTLGDPIEVAGLTEAFRKHTKRTGYCAIGSVKTNIGHLDVAAGVTGFIKTVLMLEHRQLAPSLNFRAPNPAIDFAASPFFVNTTLRPWDGIGGTRRAGVTALGMGGTNAHVIVEEAKSLPDRGSELAPRPTQVLRISARTDDALGALCGALADRVRDVDTSELGDVCFTANVGRAHHPKRVVVRGASASELCEALGAAARGDRHPRAVRSVGAVAEAPPVAFLFAGSGVQIVRMGESLYRSEPVFRAAIDRCDVLLRPHQSRSLLSVLYPADGESSPIDETTYAQPAIFAFEYALSELWKSWGVRPAAVLGHSLGEYTAACVAGLLPLDEALRLVSARARLIDAAPHGAMAAVLATEDVVRDVLRADGDHVSIASVNGPRSQVISGTVDAVTRVAARLADQQIEVKMLNVTQAFHSSMLDSMLDEYEAVVRRTTFGHAEIPIISNVSAEVLSDGEGRTARYWRRHTREPARFADGVALLHARGIRHFLEIGPHTTVSSMAAGCVPEDSALFAASLRKGRDDFDQLFEALSALYARGADVDWQAFHAGRPGRRVALPLYPFARTRHWIEPAGDALSTADIAPGIEAHPLLGRAVESPLVDVPAYELRVDRHTRRFIDDHRIFEESVYPATAYIEAAVEAVEATSGQRVTIVEDVEIAEPLILPFAAAPRAQIILRPDGPAFDFEIFSRDGDGSVASPWRRHGTGRVSTSSPSVATTATVLDIEAIRGRCSAELSGEEFYTGLVAQGFEYGTTFRGLQRLWLGEGEILGEVALAEELAGDAASYRFHPALLDACLQATLGLAPAGRSFVPLRFERFELRAWEPRLLVHVVRRVGVNDPRAIISDVRIANERGEVLAAVDGIAQFEATGRRWKGKRASERWLYEPAWREASLDKLPRAIAESIRPTSARRYAIVAARPEIGELLAAQMREHGAFVTVIASDSVVADAREALRTVVGGESLAGIVVLGPSVGATTANESLVGTQALLAVVQALISEQVAELPRLWVMTSGAVSATSNDSTPAVFDAPMWGLANVISLEHPELRCACIDVDATDQTALDAAWRAVAEDVAESRVAVRGGARFVEHLVRAKIAPVPTAASSEGRRLESSEPGTLDSLRYVDEPRRAPRAGEVEILVRATGLNFKDVLIALGRYPDPSTPLGAECAGDVVAVGVGVREFAVGDAVVAFASGSLANYVIADARLVARKPAILSFEQAATLAGGFLTAQYALHDLARLGAEDRVLIHAATGGVGLAAVQIAQRAGATIFATAGSDAKRALLKSLGVEHVFNSRTTEFAGAIDALTEGRGVTVVLNSLTGEILERSVDILADGGRFVELGVTGTLSPKATDRLARHASYFNPNVAPLAAADPARFGAMLREILSDIARGELTPLPFHVFDSGDVVSAFRLMARAGHVGKVVVRENAGMPGPGAAPRSVEIVADASYLIVGGLGGLGLLVADWLVQRGARHVAIMARREPNADEARQLARIIERGADVVVVHGDVTRRDDVRAAVVRIGETMPPLRGVIQAAGVLADGPLAQQTWARFEQVLAPKVTGSWNLHRIFQNANLDFFIVFSSIASLLGSKAQGNYAAANAFIDALAFHRRARGLPALSINWGPWSTVGMAAERGIGARVAGSGLSELSPADGLGVLDQLLGWPTPQVGVVPIDWSAYAKQFADSQAPSMLDDVLNEARSVTPVAVREKRDVEATLAERVRTVSAGERLGVVEQFLRGHVVTVLGLPQNAHVDANTPLVGMGLDSLLAVELRNTLNRGLGLPQRLPATLLFGYPTIAALSAHLLSLIVESIPTETVVPTRGGSGAEVMSPAPNDHAAIAELTDEEAEALLLEELE